MNASSSYRVATFFSTVLFFLQLIASLMTVNAVRRMRGKKLNFAICQAIIFYSETMYENRENRREGASKEQDCNLELQLRRSGRFARRKYSFLRRRIANGSHRWTRSQGFWKPINRRAIFVGICHYSARSDKRHKWTGTMSSNEIIARSHYVIFKYTYRALYWCDV